MPEPLILTVDLEKTYRMGSAPVPALQGVTLTIGSGEFVAVMGPSGSGKTTLMNLLGLLDRPSAGCYWLEGRDVGRLDADERALVRNRRIGFVFQNFNLLPRSTALENVELPLIYSGMTKAKRWHRAVEVLAAVGLRHRQDHWPHQLSGGEQQRVAIARAIAADPLIILADEPTGTLDSRTGMDIMALFQTLNRTGRTIILVTHDASIAGHAGRVVLLRDGHIVGDERTAPSLRAVTVQVG
jgi:putative ABC transport system ATP-binding protein